MKLFKLPKTKNKNKVKPYSNTSKLNIIKGNVNELKNMTKSKKLLSLSLGPEKQNLLENLTFFSISLASNEDELKFQKHDPFPQHPKLTC